MNFFKRILQVLKEEWDNAGDTLAAKQETAAAQNQLIDGLIQRGYLDHMSHISNEETERVKKKLSEQPWPFYDDPSRRLYYADEENLAEGDGGEFIEEIRPFLEKQGCMVGTVQEVCDVEYRITLNGKETLVYSEEELNAHNQRKLSIWGLSSVRIFGIVNELLEQAGSKERLYAVSGGNDQMAVFLTPGLRDFICRSPVIMKEDRPYIPVAQHPFYGQPMEERD